LSSWLPSFIIIKHGNKETRQTEKIKVKRLTLRWRGHRTNLKQTIGEHKPIPCSASVTENSCLFITICIFRTTQSALALTVKFRALWCNMISGDVFKFQ